MNKTFFDNPGFVFIYNLKNNKICLNQEYEEINSRIIKRIISQMSYKELYALKYENPENG